ncbi:MAG: cysteine desulfurase family protein [Thaumarchaeota archaeon]|nr:cysteine desulfurase family protein [Nitrososphaerota archaeon]
MIYLDNAASTPVHARVLEAMMPHLREAYGNPSSIHRSGREAARAVAAARARVAALVGAAPHEIALTSGGTESNNMAILGIARASPRSRVVTTQIEHEAVLEPCAQLESEGHAVTRVRAGRDGLVDPADIESAITADTSLVSVMAANNEVGTARDMAAVAALAEAPGVPLHPPGVRGPAKVPLDVARLGVSLMSISSHKINGPKGAGALYVRDGLRPAPVVRGGGQERGLRSGTENVAAIVGFGEACAMAAGQMAEDAARVASLRDALVAGVAERIPHSSLNGDAARRLPGNAHFAFLGVRGEDLIIKLDEHGIAASTGSACSVHTQKESHVLRAMGLGREEIDGSLRVTVGPQNTRAEIDETLETLVSCVAELRRVSPFRQKYGL